MSVFDMCYIAPWHHIQPELFIRQPKPRKTQIVIRRKSDGDFTKLHFYNLNSFIGEKILITS